MVSQGLEAKALPQYLLFLCSVQIDMNNQKFDGFSLHLDCEILHCLHLCTDYMGPQELHFEYSHFSGRKTRKAAN